ncbi:MAG: TIGR00725 family protein [Fimbriimonadaceae bacterium]
MVGGSVCTEHQADVAFRVGDCIAKADAVLLCGGRGGVMEAACRGAHEAGGVTVGILPGGSKEEANPYVQIPLATGLGEARNAVIARAADLLVAIGGEAGTLSEIAFGLKFGIEVIAYGSWQLQPPGEQPANNLVHHHEEPALLGALRRRLSH